MPAFILLEYTSSRLGKSLFSAHISMLPFLFMGIISFIRLMQKLEFRVREQWTGMLLFFAIPAVGTQYLLISYDAVLLSLFLLSLVLYLENKKVFFTIILVLIAGITGRGIFALAAIFFICFLWHRASFRSWIPLFLPAVIFYFGWYYYHYSKTGYIFAADNGWSSQRGLADAGQIFKNTISIARVLFDMGIFLLVAGNAIVIYKMKKLPVRFLVWLCPFIIFSFSFVFLTNPINHRYYLIVFVLLLLPVLKLLADKKLIYTFGLLILLIAGNFQVYPGKISNAWDSTLSHLPYYNLRNAFISYMDGAKLDRSKTGTVFPMNTSLQQTDLKDDTVRMINVNGGSIDSLPYVLYSNVGNDFSDEQIDQLKQWKVIKKEKSGCIEMILYQNPRDSI